MSVERGSDMQGSKPTDGGVRHSHSHDYTHVHPLEEGHDIEGQTTSTAEVDQAARHISLCDHICGLDAHHVEQGQPHQYGYEHPSPRNALATMVRLLRNAVQEGSDQSPRCSICGAADHSDEWKHADFLDGDRSRMNYTLREGLERIAEEGEKFNADLPVPADQWKYHAWVPAFARQVLEWDNDERGCE